MLRLTYELSKPTGFEVRVAVIRVAKKKHLYEVQHLNHNQRLFDLNI